MTGPRSPWFIVLLGLDTPWLCPRCHEAFELLAFEDRIRFLIGLSAEGANHLGGADIEEAVPPRGTVCRHCWLEVPVAAD